MLVVVLTVVVGDDVADVVAETGFDSERGRFVAERWFLFFLVKRS